MTIDVNFLYKHYYQLFVGFAKAIMNGDAEAEDIVQGALVKFHTKKGAEFESADEARKYVNAIIKNDCFNRQRRIYVERKYQRYVQENESEAEYECSVDELFHHIVSKRIQELIALLPPKRRQIFILVYKDGMSFQDVAKKLKVSYSTVRIQYKDAVDFFIKNIRRK